MGLLDNFMKTVDTALQAVEKGALEEKLNAFADAVEKRVEQVPDKLGKVAEVPDQLNDTIQAKKETAERLAQRAREGVREVNDIVRRPE